MNTIQRTRLGPYLQERVKSHLSWAQMYDNEASRLEEQAERYRQLAKAARAQAEEILDLDRSVTQG